MRRTAPRRVAFARLVGALLAAGLLAGCARPAAVTSGASGVGTGGSATSAVATPSGAAASLSAVSQSIGSDGSSAVVPSPVPSSAPAVLPSSGSAPVSASARGGVSTPLPACRAEKLPTRVHGVLTVAAPTVLTTPWFSGSDPSVGGLDPAVVAAVATTLGFAADDIRWVRADASATLAGRSSGFDMAVGAFAIPDQPGGAVDYTTGYFSVSSVVVAKAGQVPTASIAGLGTVRLASGSQRQTQAVADSVGAGATVSTLGSGAAALAAVRSGAAQAAVVDEVSALAAHDLTIVGALPAAAKTADPQLGMVTPRGSALTSCLSTALDVLRVQGSLTSIADAAVPVTTLQ